MLFATVATAVISFFISRRTIPDGEFRLVGNRVWLGNARLPTFHAFWSRDTRQKVARALNATQHSRILDLTKFREKGLRLSQPNSFRLGIDLEFDLSSGAGHLLVIGPTGSGKSELIHLAVASVSENVELAIADFKGAALLTELRQIARHTSDIESLEHQGDFWANLSTELTNREQWLRNHGVTNWSHAEKLSIAPNRLLVIIDEVVSAIRTSPQAADLLVRIATKGRSLGMHLLVTSQSLVGISREVLINLRSRIALAGTDEVELMQLGCKEKMGVSLEQTKAAVLIHDGQAFSLQVPLGIRREPHLGS